MVSLKYSLKITALAGITNAGTLKQYQRQIDRFASWAKQSHQIRQASDVIASRALSQEYADFLIGSNYSPDTIHNYLAPIAKGFGLCLSEIEKPLRRANNIKKARDLNANKRGVREMNDPQNKRLVDAAKMIGIRRHELASLTGDCAVQDFAGNLCVLVRRGKGGKMQMQRILPCDVSQVMILFSCVAPYQKLFSSTNMNNQIPIHALRRIHAQYAYDYYLDLVQTGHRQEIFEDLKSYFTAYHIKSPGSKGERRFAKQFANFCSDCTKGNGVYRLRGDNVIRAKQAGRPLEYDRVALMAVSVFHLAHWRNNVTARNYMI